MGAQSAAAGVIAGHRVWVPDAPVSRHRLTRPDRARLRSRRMAGREYEVHVRGIGPSAALRVHVRRFQHFHRPGIHAAARLAAIRPLRIFANTYLLAAVSMRLLLPTARGTSYSRHR